MTIYTSDYVGMQMSKARMEELRREAVRFQQAREVLNLRHIKHRLRLPKITISWN
ncbi:MAG: hypothetical protein K8J31_14995 [Anaerolineae bacterium]|nr:hypothetical protein [Anaerolineae bacterium]